MNDFEQLVAELLRSEGYWVQTSFRVRLDKIAKVYIDRPTSPDWEIDIVAFKGGTNELFALECKSFFDSTGVQRSELEPCVGTSKGRYKLFCESALREFILERIRKQCVEDGLCPSGGPAILGMVAGKLKNGDESAIAKLFAQEGWVLFDQDWLKSRLKSLAAGAHRNHVGAYVAKILIQD